MNVEELQILITAETQGLKKEMSGVKKQLSGLKTSTKEATKVMSKGFKSAAKSVAKLGVAVTAAAGGLLLIAKNSSEALDRIDKMSQQMGFSTETFQEWDYIMSKTGGNIEGLSEGMESLLRTMSASAKGEDTVFDTLGISAIKATGQMKSQGEIFEEIIERLQSINDPTRRAALAFELFGGSAKELIPTLNGGADAVANLKQEARDLGIIMDGAAVSAGVQFNDAMQQMGQALAPLGAALVQAFLPIVQTVIPWIVGLVKHLRIAITYVTAFFGMLFKKAQSPLGELDKAVGEVNSTTEDVKIALPEQLEEGVKQAKKLKGMLAGFDELNVMKQDSDSSVGEGFADIDFGGISGMEMPDMSFETDSLDDALNDYNKSIDGAKKKIENFLSKTKKLWDKWGKNIAITLAAVGAGLAAFASFKFIGEILGGIGWAALNLTGALGPLGTWLLEVTGKIAHFLGKIGLIGSFWTDATAIFGGATTGIVVAAIALIVGALVDAYLSFEDFRNLVHKALKNIGTTFVLLWTTILKPTFKAIWEALKDMWTQGLKPLWDKWVLFVKALASLVLEIFNTLWPLVNWFIDKFGPMITITVKALIKVFKDTFVMIAKVVGHAIDIITGTIEYVIAVFKGLTDFIVGIFTGDWDRAWGGIKDIFEAFIKLIRTTIDGLLGAIGAIAEWIIGVFVTMWTAAWDRVAYFFGLFGDSISKAIDGIKEFFLGILTWIGGVFSTGWSTAWEGIVEVFTGIFDGLKTVFSGIINFLIKGMNVFIRGINKINIKIPDWIADLVGIDGGSFGFNVKEIPLLADGGMVNSGQMFIANEAGPELVGSFGGRTGVMNNNQIVESVSAGVYQAVLSAMGNQQQSNDNPIEITLQVGSTEFGKVAVDSINKLTRQEGKIALNL